MNKEKSQKRKEQILKAASELISRYGVNRITMDDIAREAGVSKGALYLVWASKDELFDSLIIYEMKRVILDFQKRIDNDPEGGRIANLYQHALLALKNNPLVSALYTQDSRVLGDFVKHQDRRRYTDRVLLSKEFIRRAQSAGLVRNDFQTEAIAYLLSIIAVGFIHIGTVLPPEEQPSQDEISTVLAGVLQEGLAGPGGDAEVAKRAISRINDFVLHQYDEDEMESLGA